MRPTQSTLFLKQGFTLMELLIVLSLIATAAALIIPRINTGDSTRLQAEVRELVAVLNYARRMALIQGQEMSVKLYPPVSEENGAPLPEQRRTQAGQWYSQGVSIESKGSEKNKEELGATHEIFFYPGGGSNGGEFELKSGELRAQISIDPLTGKLKAEFNDE